MLREYQKIFLRNLAISVKQLGDVIGCLPTGGGKTIVFTEIAKRAIERGNTCLIVTESRKIFQQIQAGANGIEITAKVGSHIYVYPNRVYVAMAQTLVRRPFILDQFEKLFNSLICIVDEAHIGTSTKLLRQLPAARKIGFTATPVYENAKHLPEIYKGIVVGAQVSDLIQDGYLMPYRHFARVSAELDKLKLKNGEYTEESQKLAFENSAVFDGLLEDIQQLKYRKAMIFCSSIDHCEDVFEMLQFNNINCVRYHSKHELSAYDLARFEQEDDCNVCVSVAALNKGYDFPKIDMTCLLFSTTSLPRYLQSIGRASRLYPGKNNHVCIDYGNNWHRHGFWDMDRPYETLWMPDNESKKKKKEKEQVAAVKYCPKCMAILFASTLVCPYCGALLKEAKEPQQGELVEITERYNELVGKFLSELTPKELSIYVRLKNKRIFGARIAKAQDQKKKGWLDDYAKEMNYSSRWPAMMRQQTGEQIIEFQDLILK